jgi:hypothetical protein
MSHLYLILIKMLFSTASVYVGGPELLLPMFHSTPVVLMYRVMQMSRRDQLEFVKDIFYVKSEYQK